MQFPNTNLRMASIFENGQLPTMVYINCQDYKRKTVIRPLHKHDSICEILLIYKGSGTYHVEGEEYPLSEGSVSYYNQGSLHEVEAEKENEIGSYCIGITNLRKKGLQFNHLTAPGEALVRQAESLFPVLKAMCEQMFELEGSNTEGKLAAQLLCVSFILLTSRLEKFPAMAETKNKEEQMVLRIRNYLNQNFTDDISLDSVAEALGCSSTYVSHVFKKATGHTPIQYVIKRRIGHAQTLLISTDYSASQIATMVGYDNTNYFSTLFSKMVGMPPIKYRQFYKEEMKGSQNQS